MHFLFFSSRKKNDIHNKHKIQDKINNVRTQALLEYNATEATLISNFLEIWLKNAKSALKPLNKMSRYKFIYVQREGIYVLQGIISMYII
jgi:hypothetical protein